MESDVAAYRNPQAPGTGEVWDRVGIFQAVWPVLQARSACIPRGPHTGLFHPS